MEEAKFKNGGRDYFQKTEHAHKDLTAENYVDYGDMYRWLRDSELNINFDPKNEGGWVLNQNGEHVGYIRPPFWRKSKGDENLRPSDIQPLEPLGEKSHRFGDLKSGSELELFVVHQNDGTEASAFEDGGNIDKSLDAINAEGYYTPVDHDPYFSSLSPDARKIRFGKELARFTVEMNGYPSSDPIERGLSFARTQKVLANVCEDKGWYLNPISAFPYRGFEAHDVSNDAYLQRIVMNNEMWPKQKSLNYVGNCTQFHAEIINPEAGLKALNMYQLVSPLLLATSLSSPFYHGKIEPNMKSILIDKEHINGKLNPKLIDTMDKPGRLSIREESRYLCGIDAGILHNPLPENMDDYYKQVETLLNFGSIPHPDRGGGQHADRYKFSTKTLETHYDTFGGNVYKFLAMQEFAKTAMWKLQLFAQDSNSLQWLEQNHPNLFRSHVTKQDLDIARLNTIAVSQSGFDTQLKAASGEEIDARSMLYEFINFVNQPIPELGFEGLSENVINEIVKSSITPTNEDFKMYKDANGIPSARGFFETGIGTPAHWLKHRALVLRDKYAMSEQEAIRNSVLDLSESYHEHLRNLNGQDIVDLYTK